MVKGKIDENLLTSVGVGAHDDPQKQPPTEPNRFVDGKSVSLNQSLSCAKGGAEVRGGGIVKKSSPKQSNLHNPSVIFLRKCHLPLHKEGFLVSTNGGRVVEAPTPTKEKVMPLKIPQTAVG